VLLPGLLPPCSSQFVAAPGALLQAQTHQRARHAALTALLPAPASQKRFWLDLNPAAVIPVGCTLTQALIAIGELTGASRKATARQIETLVKAKVLAEDDEELDQLTKAEASKLISELFAK